MFTAREYVRPESIDEAYRILMTRPANRVIGGCAWLRLGKKRINTAIDLSLCQLDYIREDDELIRIGAMTSYRSIETSEVLKNYASGIVSRSVMNIVGTQFRNTVTVGGSVYGRFGFSDFLTALLVLDAEVILYKQGSIPLHQYMTMPYEKDILLELIIHKGDVQASYQMFRNSAADFPVVNLAVSKEEQYHVVVGARSGRAMKASETEAYLNNIRLTGEIPTRSEIEHAADILLQEIPFTDNMRASAAYRRLLSIELFKRAMAEVE